MAFKFLSRVVSFIILALVALSQPSPPAEGIQIGNPLDGWDVRFPLRITQCEPVFIYYNNTNYTDAGVGFRTLDSLVTRDLLLFIGPFPLGVGYFEWICNIPADLAFYAFAGVFYRIVVQSGPISSCLGVMTTTNPLVFYETTNFVTFTASRPITTLPFYMSPTRLATYVHFFYSCPPDTYPCQINCTFPNRGLPNGYCQV